jgi:hypothetical protein
MSLLAPPEMLAILEDAVVVAGKKTLKHVLLPCALNMLRNRIVPSYF